MSVVVNIRFKSIDWLLLFQVHLYLLSEALDELPKNIYSNSIQNPPFLDNTECN